MGREEGNDDDKRIEKKRGAWDPCVFFFKIYSTYSAEVIPANL